MLPKVVLISEVSSYWHNRLKEIIQELVVYRQSTPLIEIYRERFQAIAIDMAHIHDDISYLDQILDSFPNATIYVLTESAQLPFEQIRDYFRKGIRDYLEKQSSDNEISKSINSGPEYSLKVNWS